MDVKDFVEATLRSVIDGVAAAQEHAARRGAAVSPKIPMLHGTAHDTLGFTHGGALITKVHFDVAVTAKDQIAAKGGASVQVAGHGGASKSTASEGSVSRIQFFVTIALPVDSATAEEIVERDRQSRLSAEAFKRRPRN